MTDSNPFDAFLAKMSQSSFHKMKLGSGPVGKLAWFGVVAFVAIGFVACKIGVTGWLGVCVIGIMALMFFVLVGGIIYLVMRQPELSVLEGMELVRWKELTTIGAKDFTPEKELPPVPDPKIDSLLQNTNSNDDGSK